MKLTGGCNCGQVRYEIEGEPLRVGLCHCETCRKETGSAFSYFGVWPRARAKVSGDTRSWNSRAGARHFCPSCGSSLFGAEEGHAEIEFKLGTLDDAPSDLEPGYELWTIRRERWFAALAGAEQHDRDRLSEQPT
jgi:hypothetical protein